VEGCLGREVSAGEGEMGERRDVETGRREAKEGSLVTVEIVVLVFVAVFVVAYLKVGEGELLRSPKLPELLNVVLELR